MRARFGVSIIPSASGRSDPVAEARRAEELGLDLVTVWDHPHGELASFETWTLMTWIAARTSRITVASDVLGVPFRLPAMVAKMAESFDRLSNGRLVLGLGAGSADAEAAGVGAPVRRPREKVDALEEALTIVRGVWAQPSYTHAGAHYRTDAARLEPKPAHRIPIWVGAYGTRALEVTGRLADGWIPSMPYLPPALARNRLEVVRAAAERAGRDPDELEVAYNVGVRVGGPPAPDPDRQIVGTPAEVVDRLASLLELGFTVLNLSRSGQRDEQLERLGEEVVPALRRR